MRAWSFFLCIAHLFFVCHLLFAHRLKLRTYMHFKIVLSVRSFIAVISAAINTPCVHWIHYYHMWVQRRVSSEAAGCVKHECITIFKFERSEAYTESAFEKLCDGFVERKINFSHFFTSHKHFTCRALQIIERWHFTNLQMDEKRFSMKHCC